MNRHQRRAQKCQPKKYTYEDVEREVDRAIAAVSMQNVRISIAACALALHRDFGFGKQRLERVLESIFDIAQNALSPTELTKQVEKETGIDLSYLEDRAVEGV